MLMLLAQLAELHQ